MVSAALCRVHVDGPGGPLEIGFEAHGQERNLPLILLHGFPYDVRAYDEVAPALAADGYRVLVPYLRGYGSTRFLDPNTPRSGEQAALGADLLAFMDALKIERAFLAGYDWGGRAACIVAALWPERVAGLVTGEGYNIQNIKASVHPAAAEMEHRLWYQYYFHSPRGEAGLTTNRAGLCRLLWRLWSPGWRFDEATFARSLASFDNPDFVPVVIHSYRHRFGYAPGNPELAPIEARLAAQPSIGVPTIALHGADDGVAALEAASRDLDRARFTGPYRRRVLPGAGHNFPQEQPLSVIDAVRELRQGL